MKKPTRRPPWPADAAARVRAARDRGASFEAIARDFGVSFATVRNKAIALGLHAAVPRRRARPKKIKSSAPTIWRMLISQRPLQSSGAAGARSGSGSSTT
jgi:hypothetical protein